MTLYYKSSTGQIIDLNDENIWSDTPETLLESGWKYTTTSTYAESAQVDELYREPRTHALDISIIADNQTEFNNIISDMVTAFEGDNVAKRPGRLYWGNMYRECFCVGRRISEFISFAECASGTLTFLSTNPSWVEEIEVHVSPSTGDSEGLEIPFSIPFTIPITSRSPVFNLQHYQKSNFKLVAYGPASTVNIKIGDNTYKVEHAVASGEYLTIDSRETAAIDKACYLTKSDGTTENLFNYRGSDSIFEKIAEGASSIEYSQTYGIDLTIYKERSDPRWI